MIVMERYTLLVLLIRCVFNGKVNGFCNITIPQDISLCSTKEEVYCNNNIASECLNRNTVSQVSLFAIDEIIKALLNVTVAVCCDPCRGLKLKHTYESTIDLYQSIANGSEKSDFIYPILGTKSTKQLYGRYFIPIIDIQSTVLVTPKINGTMLMDKLIMSCFSLLPLLGICLLMALASGFIIWLLDTWSNEEQFPRNFVHGIYEGFWWAFISMTTVGYGDKTPVSLAARVYGIFWIIVGITICSMLTASLTTIIINAGAPPSIHIAGKKIVVMKHRLLDASYVLSNGGILYKELTPHEIDGELTHDTENIHGFITDHITVSFFRKFYGSSASKYDYQHMPSTTKVYSYGMLVKDAALYNYLQPFFEENALFYETCNLLLMGGHSDEQMSKDPFHPENGAFWAAVLGISIICAIFALVGITFEVVRRKKRKSVNTCSKGRSEDDVIQGIKSLLNEWTEIKKENIQTIM